MQCFSCRTEMFAEDGFVICPKCHQQSKISVLVEKYGYRIDIKNGGNNMENKSCNDKIKIESTAFKIRELLKQNICTEEIMKQLNVPRKKILDQRWQMAHKK